MIFNEESTVFEIDSQSTLESNNNNNKNNEISSK